MKLSRIQTQRNSSWNAPYTFSGKEKDAETGYGYFGARYYDSGLSIWLSVDPMSDKYPSMSPYNYCANNPVNLVDPDGRAIDWHSDGKGNLVADKGDSYETLCAHLATIYGGIDKVPSGELLAYKLQIGAYNGRDIEGLKLNGSFNNLTGNYLVTMSKNETFGLKPISEPLCSPTSFCRADFALNFVYGKDILGLPLWENPIYKSWQGYPTKEYPAWGTAIIPYMNYGKLVSFNEIMNGYLQPGALLKMQLGTFGHAGIFLNYTYDGNGIITGVKFWDHFPPYVHTTSLPNGEYQVIRGANFN